MPLTKEESGTEITYTSPEGIIHTVQKDEDFLDVHVRIPIAYTQGKTWQDMCDQLDAKVTP